MSKDRCRMTRKRFVKKMAAKHGLQVREVRDMVHNDVVDPAKRMQEEYQTEKHRYAQREVRR